VYKPMATGSLLLCYKHVLRRRLVRMRGDEQRSNVSRMSGGRSKFSVCGVVIGVTRRITRKLVSAAPAGIKNSRKPVNARPALGDEAPTEHTLLGGKASDPWEALEVAKRLAVGSSAAVLPSAPSQGSLFGR
jgi:hypothetical protein